MADYRMKVGGKTYDLKDHTPETAMKNAAILCDIKSKLVSFEKRMETIDGVAEYSITIASPGRKNKEGKRTWKETIRIVWLQEI